MASSGLIRQNFLIILGLCKFAKSKRTSSSPLSLVKTIVLSKLRTTIMQQDPRMCCKLRSIHKSTPLIFLNQALTLSPPHKLGDQELPWMKNKSVMITNTAQQGFAFSNMIKKKTKLVLNSLLLSWKDKLVSTLTAVSNVTRGTQTLKVNQSRDLTF